MTEKQLETIENKLLKELDKKPIRIIGVLKKRKESLSEFIKTFFNKWNIDRETIFVEDKKIQTEANKRRSLGDIYMICKYYYPKCTLEEVLKVLLITNVSNKDFRSSYCFKINKRVWYYEEGKGLGVYNKDSKDEYGFTYNDYLKLLE